MKVGVAANFDRLFRPDEHSQNLGGPLRVLS